jgi:hypothetical protein
MPTRASSYDTIDNAINRMAVRMVRILRLKGEK